MPGAWHVHKFGGTSVAGAERYRNVARIVAGAEGRRAVVVSAMAGVTDALLDLVDAARTRDGRWRDRFGTVLVRHREAAADLLPEGPARTTFLDHLDQDARDLEDLFRATWLMRSASDAALEFISGHGEVWSARLLTALLEQEGLRARMIDARDVLTVEASDVGPRVDWEHSLGLLQPLVPEDEKAVLVITGYVARTANGTPTTLKRNGSDLSASIFGNLLDATAIVIWTDVAGVLTADPRKVPEARVTRQLSYAEAAELAYFGAKVLHPHTMAPAIDKQIPIYIKSSFEPEKPGSKICAEPDPDADLPVVGFATVDKIALVNLEGTGMIGVPGIAERMFRALSDAEISVALIAQASSEHSICVAVPAKDGERARAVVERAFTAEIQDKQVDGARLFSPCSILAAVGERMAEVPGVAGRLMTALGNAGVNVRAVAQGASERNISVVVDEADAPAGLRSVHASFTLSDQTLSLGIIGPGLIGATLLEQLREQHALLSERFKIDLRVRALCDSKKMILVDDALDLSRYVEALEQGEPVDLEKLAAWVDAPHLPHGAIVDCTASEAVAALTPTWLRQGLHVVTPNKKACAGPLSRYRELDELRKKSRVHFFYEATVGAGLPVLSTLRDLLKTGDRVLRVEGILSGTLSYLFNTYDGTTPFSALVKDARERGYTEPDPRDDLSGMDVARKVVILAREMGLAVSLDDVEVESLVPGDLGQAADAEAFLAGLPAFDGAMAERLAEAQKEGAVLRYVGTVDPERGCRVELRKMGAEHAFARVSGSDNIFAFTTARYREQPLIVQGPGAGPAVTAGGVFSDLLRLAGHLGARS